MDLIKRDNNNFNHILLKDHIPNPAFINEFQTNFFTLKLNSMEMVEDKLGQYIVEEGGIYLLLHVVIRNNTNEILELIKEDFLVSYDDGDAICPEEYFEVPFQFEDEFALKPLEEKKGILIYIIAKNVKKISFIHNEYYDEDHFKRYHLRYRL